MEIRPIRVIRVLHSPEARLWRLANLGAFELDFSHKIDLDAFSGKVATGTGEMKMWLVEADIIMSRLSKVDDGR